MAMTRQERIEKYPSLSLVCPWCKKEFTTDSSDKLDRRTRFCCARCERQWWRKKTRHPNSLTNQYKGYVLSEVDRYSHGNETQIVLANMVSENEYEELKAAMNAKERAI